MGLRADFNGLEKTKPLASVGVQTSDCLSHSLVPKPTMLPGLTHVVSTVTNSNVCVTYIY